MKLLKQCLSPAGILAILIGFWLPWADVRCAQVRTEPDYWQLAKADDRMLLLLIPVVAMVLCIIWSLRSPRKSLALATAVSAIVAVGGWTYLWFKKDEMAEYQAKVASGTAGDLGRIFKNVEVVMGTGYKLYLAGTLLVLVGAALHLARGESDSPQ
jgi:TRAP-type uncharacterized transport system fused permease subunit